MEGDDGGGNFPFQTIQQIVDTSTAEDVSAVSQKQGKRTSIPFNPGQILNQDSPSTDTHRLNNE